MKVVLLLLLLLVSLAPVSVRGADYVIGEGDSLDISVWGVKELNFPVKVRPDGKITVPGLGEVVASGATPSQLQTMLGGRLKELVKNPIVTVTVREITNSKVYVFGSGVKAAVYDLSRRTTLLQLLCTLPEVKAADLRNAYLLRDGKKVKTDLHRLFIQGDTTQDLPLESNDSLFVPLLQDRSVYIMGAVAAPKAIEYREGMKVMEAILEAGGFTRFADQNDVVVRRKDGDKAQALEVKAKRLFKDGDLSQNIELKAGDYVMVKEAFF
ncbi:polysaccharide biosynthesis/export family protein [Geomonas paludis]|uniref:Polysaccharide biosynthesis/export family protein n=1 Tax=Geomonas paludis TaxID=2740185 RepID=A0A6V8MWR5_9BACT|nr:polysaccharide biosynthesis/export family protein [Geomonas paludis]UPU37752.1 polysaccharide biosynthesis/export family protein [Geomonas paludis]GFO63709.1 sugar ABC transporter substrate-binding protein [Geomonas paludis]